MAQYHLLFTVTLTIFLKKPLAPELILVIYKIYGEFTTVSGFISTIVFLSFWLSGKNSICSIILFNPFIRYCSEARENIYLCMYLGYKENVFYRLLLM